MTQLHRLQVKVTLQGHVIYPSISVRAISPEYFDWFLLNFTQMFLMITWYSMSQTQGQGIYPWISCPLHISETLI